jgi:hypothetical protein
MASESPEQRDVLYYFCDESSFLGEEYMTVGGFAVSRNGVGKITKELLAINETKRARGEIKWHNTRKRGVEIRKAYIDYLMKQIASNYIHFHIRFSPMNEYKHDGDRREFDTVSKMFYQLLLHRPLRHYGKTCILRIRPDDGDCTRLLPNFKNALLFDGQLTYNTQPEYPQHRPTELTPPADASSVGCNGWRAHCFSQRAASTRYDRRAETYASSIRL